ncbi:MAG: hypothetical protein Kow0059_10230 [Candidatus Sumerlaeia bacterium]
MTHFATLFCAVLVMFWSVSCGGPEANSSKSSAPSASSLTMTVDKTTTPAAPSVSPAPPSASPARRGGKVLETLNAGGYTYVHVTSRSGEFWVAGPPCEVKVGDEVMILDSMLMTNFESKSLNRTFPEIYFASEILVGSEAGQASSSAMPQLPEGHPDVTGMLSADQSGAVSGQQLPEGHPDVSGMTEALGHPDPSADSTAASIDFNGIGKPDGGLTIAEIYARRKELTDKEVYLRGRVVKFNRQILGKNWLHVRDGSGVQGSNDLTVTTQDTAAVGDTVLVRGVLRADRDFGFNYKYDLIVEDARVSVETTPSAPPDSKQ